MNSWIVAQLRFWLDYRVMNSSQFTLIRLKSSALLTALLTELRYFEQAFSLRMT